MVQLVNKIKNVMRKKFRIVKNELSEEGLKAFHPLRYRIEQRHTILFFIHWWGTPEFEPPHLFENDCDAMKHIKKHHPNAVVYEKDTNKYLGNCYVDELGDMYVKSPYHKGEILYIE